jgi:hypothetical protein
MEPKVVSKYGLTCTLHDFGQKVFEQYQLSTMKASRDAFVKFDGEVGVSASASVRGETVRAALKHGILSGITNEDIDQAKPYAIAWLADEIKAHVIAVTTEPADPN